jgi:nucleoside-diphosphate-sugar epimerase
MKVLVTGASGFIGSQVARQLLAQGCEVAVLAVPDDDLIRLQDVAERLTVLRVDMMDNEKLPVLLAEWKPEACVHLAWYVEPGKYLDSLLNTSTLAASLRLMETLAGVGCAHFVGAGTCFEYLWNSGWLHEDGPTDPQTLYAAAKLSLCLTGKQLARQLGMKFAWGRIFYLYGPTEDERRAVPALYKALLAGKEFAATTGMQVRDYLHVEDVAAGFCTLVTKGAEGIYNIGSGVPVTMRRLMQTAGEIVGRADLIRFGAYPDRPQDPPFICADARKLRALGWTPRYTLEEGLAAMLEQDPRFHIHMDCGSDSQN